ncbi:GIY-YIG nuclease family protein [Xanthomonas dyei]|uniref:GIY-YIG nuclease family protein n=1 Tax=Xanthomonas dyei TaxID=743699 RepID=A0ABZ0D6T0_9XANT|nr:GIY-YIG nuclease family protein [Xanthomonas dyei]WOB25912.1 GIY-YIG nuclease family protein [Xanthomonas dyei]WOB53535.1 GIY-YIG nuclease family protein [Xanthomonas dyei]
MAEQYLYLLLNREATAFKIGVAFQPLTRGAQLPQSIDSEKSLQIPMSGGSAIKVEKILHYLFQSHSFEMPRGDGYTEWFAVDALGDVLKFLDEQRDRLGIGVPEPIPPKVYEPRQPKPQDLDLLERRRMRKEAQEQRYFTQREAATVNNLKAIESLTLLTEEWSRQSAVIGTLIGDAYNTSTAHVYLKDATDELLDGIRSLMPSSLVICSPKSSGSFSIFSSTYHDPAVGTEVAMPASLLVPDQRTDEDVPGIGQLRTVLNRHLSPATGEKKISLLRLKRQLDDSRQRFHEEFWTHWRENSGGIF